MAKEKPSKKIIDEVSLAWAKIQHKDKSKAAKKGSGDAQVQSEEEKENLEEAITPQEKSEFVSTLPERAPSLEFNARQNLESAIGTNLKKEEDKEEDEKGYSSPKDYLGKKEEKYNRLDFAESITVRAPTAFEHTDLSEIANKGRHMHMNEFIAGKQEQLLDYTVKDFRNEKIELDISKKAKKYISK